jgi:PKD repeat protein
MLTTRRLGAISVAFVTLVLIGLLAWRDGPPTLASPGGLANPGFEDGLDPWVIQSAADAATVVGQEGPADFQTYADQGITVSPFLGDLMLRLGSPKRIAEKQEWGASAVFQTFTSDRDTLRFAFRLFSWEHRGDDVFRFELEDNVTGRTVFPVRDPDDPAGGPIKVTLGGSVLFSCSQTPCERAINVGKRGDFLDSGWVKVEIGDLPDNVGSSLTLTYSVIGGQNKAHATWAYFDNTNTPPVAKFTFSPPQPWEGDFIQFEDLSYDLDPGDFIASWEWVIEGIDGELFTFNTQNPFSIFPDEGIYDVTLTVTDTYGASNTVSAGGIATDGDAVPLVAAVNGPPLVNALNIEAVAGQETSLFGRFLDSGWLDSHSPPAANQATWTLNGDEFAAALEEDNIPALATGIATGQVTPTGDLEGTLVIWDEDGNSGSDSFQVTIVPDDPNSREPNDTVASAPQLRSDSIYPAYIQSAGDVDVFELLSPDGEPLPADAQVLVTLSDLPADYDLVIVSQLPEGGLEPAPYLRSDFGTIGFESLPYLRSPYLRSPYLRSPYLRSPYLRSPYLRSPYLRSPYLRSEMTFDLYPLSEMGFTGLDGTEIGGTDIDLEELGLGAIDGENLKVAGFSASRGQEEERVLAVADFPGTRLFAVVVGANEAHSLLPASLRAEMSVRLDLGAALSPEICDRSALFDHSTAGVETLHAYSGTAQTLLVTQRERIISLYGQPAWDNLLSGLEALADDDAVRGDIISMPASLYADWDANACGVDAANDVAAAIRDEIQSRLEANANIQYVVLVGSDDVIPYRRVADETIISNERDYLVDSFLKPGSPLFAAFDASKNLTDDYFVDGQPSPWQGRELYIPDLPIGRLVETPQEIQAAAAAFLASNGILDPSTGFVSGYDFFSDGSQVMADNLAAELATDDSLIRDDWTADELRCRFLGQDGGPECAVPDVSAVNAHFTHYAALSADGFATNDFDDILSSDDVAASGDSDGVAFSMGCHAGLNVPDYAVDSDLGLGIDPALDFAQAMQRAVYVASTGYGLGDNIGIAGTEAIMTILADELVQGDVAAGLALVSAKQTYLNSLSAMTVYDEKSSIQATLYGLPMYRVQVPSEGVTSSAAAVQSLAGESTTPETLELTIEDGGVPTTSYYALDEVATDDGSYFTADGDAQATAGRAVQPRVVIPIPSDPAGPVHGVLLEAGTFTDLAARDPLISLPTDEWVLEAAEPQICFGAGHGQYRGGGWRDRPDSGDHARPVSLHQRRGPNRYGHSTLVHRSQLQAPALLVNRHGAAGDQQHRPQRRRRRHRRRCGGGQRSQRHRQHRRTPCGGRRFGHRDISRPQRAVPSGGFVHGQRDWCGRRRRPDDRRGGRRRRGGYSHC